MKYWVKTKQDSNEPNQSYYPFVAFHGFNDGDSEYESLYKPY